jgi:CubicO group peptidase (beta-lactamase class C family)
VDLGAGQPHARSRPRRRRRQGRLREFGKAAGPRAFGASGLGGQIAWADPGTGLSFCFLTDGLVDLVRAFLRSSRLSTLAAECNTF